MSGGTLTKAEIVEFICEKSEFGRRRVKLQVEALLEIMKNAIKHDQSLLISCFGKFEAYDKQSHKGHNPRTGEVIVLPGRMVVVFFVICALILIRNNVI